MSISLSFLTTPNPSRLLKRLLNPSTIAALQPIPLPILPRHMPLPECLHSIPPPVILFRNPHPFPTPRMQRSSHLDVLPENRHLSLHEPQPHDPDPASQQLGNTLLAQMKRNREEDVVRPPVHPRPRLDHFQQKRHAARVDELDEIHQLDQRTLASNVGFFVARHIRVDVLARVGVIRVCAWDRKVSCVFPLEFCR